jgi:hypothetical protein
MQCNCGVLFFLQNSALDAQVVELAEEVALLRSGALSFEHRCVCVASHYSALFALLVCTVSTSSGVMLLLYSAKLTTSCLMRAGSLRALSRHCSHVTSVSLYR